MLKFVKDMLAQARSKKGMSVYVPELENLEARLTVNPDDPAANSEAREMLLALRPALKDDLPDPPAPTVVIHPGIANLRQSAGLAPIDPTAAPTLGTAPPMGGSPVGSGGSPPPPLLPEGMPPPPVSRASTKLKIPKREVRSLAELEKLKTKDWATENPVDKIADHRPAAISGVRLPTADSGAVASRPKKAFLKVKELDSVNSALETSGSLFRMEAVGSAGEDGFVEIRPQFHGSADDVETSNRFIPELNTARKADLVSEDGLIAWADCHKMAQMVMGIAPSKEVLSLPGGREVKPLSSAEADEIRDTKTVNSEASRMVHTLYGAALPGFAKSLKDDTSSKAVKVRAAIERAQTAQSDSKNKVPLVGRKSYKAILAGIDDKDSHDYKIYDDFCREFGINHHAMPDVGDAFTIVNDDVEFKKRKAAIAAAKEAKTPPPPDVWNFHWAGVVAVNDDGSYMTLENTSTEHMEDVNDDWYYAVYDPAKGQDFHSVHKNDPAILSRAITVLVRGGGKKGK